MSIVWNIPVRARLSAVLFGAAACFELSRVVFRWPWPGVLPALSHFISVSLAALWLTAAGLQLLLLRTPRFGNAAQMVCIAGSLMMVFHAAITRVLGSYLGLGYLALALCQVALLYHAFDWRQRPAQAAPQH